MLQQPSNTPNPILVGVHGLDSVKQFPFKPNQTLSFHDLDADFEYIVDTDVNNQPSFKILKFSQITEDEYREEYAKAVNKDLGLPTAEEYAALIKEHNEALKRLEKLEKEVSANAQQSIRYQKSGSNNADSSAKSATRPANTRDVSEVKPQQ